MNLENLSVQEMNTQEMKNVDGGFIGLLIAGIMVAALLLWPKDAN